MSWLSTAIKDVERFFENSPEGKTALSNLETAGLNLAEVAINEVVGKIPGGAIGTAIADAFLQDVIAGLQAKQSKGVVQVAQQVG
jgi:hypothetical protein